MSLLSSEQVAVLVVVLVLVVVVVLVVVLVVDEETDPEVLLGQMQSCLARCGAGRR